MAESFMAAELGVIEAAADEIPRAYEQARSLEAQAKVLREESVEAHTIAFEAANLLLKEQFDTGSLTSIQVIKAVADLNDRDPAIVRLYRGKRGEKVVSAFAALQPGAPVLDLHGKDRSYTGIVSAAAEVSELTIRRKSRSPGTDQPFMAPWGLLTVALRTRNHEDGTEEVTAEVEILGLASAIIGRTAIKALVEEAHFTTGSDGSACHPGTVTNSIGLRYLKQEIEKLHKLGMDPVDTQQLDEALVTAHKWHTGRNEMVRLQRYRASSPFLPH